MIKNSKTRREVLTGVAFLAPNIIGFLTFTAVPLVISFFMAFTDWNLELHNIFKDNPVKWVGFDNFRELFNDRDFYKYIGNTLFFMMGIPFAVAASLIAAMFLSANFRGTSRRIWYRTIATIGLTIGCGLLVAAGAGGTAMTLLLTGMAGVILISGSVGGQTVYRTLFYFPHFTAGVATFILWKKLYSPQTGPINNALRPVLENLSGRLSTYPPLAFTVIMWVMLILIAGLAVYGFIRNAKLWRDGYKGTASYILGSLILGLPLYLAMRWFPLSSVNWLLWGPESLPGWLPLPETGSWLPLLPLIACLIIFTLPLIKSREYPCNKDKGLADSFIIGGLIMTFSMILLGLSRVVVDLPVMAAEGIQAPTWISSPQWSKPSLMIMGFWASIGSNNMLLYLAGLSGVPQELYEAADIDGANAIQKFWNVTWPQLANVTFFIFVMAIIHGLQGGFEMARTMTQGGPAGSTMTLSYYIFNEGFMTGRLGFGSAASWALFALVFSVTIFNWKFGNRYTNE